MCAPVVSVNVVYIDRHGERREIRGKVGDNALYLAYRYGIEMEGELQNATVLIVVCPVPYTLYLRVQFQYCGGGLCQPCLGPLPINIHAF